MTDNTSLWGSVEKTDPKHTSKITGKAYQGNSPKPYFIVKRATDTFGPCGIGWGFQIIEEKLLDGAMLEPGFYEKIHMARVRVWYKWNGERGEVEHVGQTAFSGKRRDGKTYTDEDAPKKSVTDALIKALSMIGFAGDIFMGRFDDSKYVAEVSAEFEGKRHADNLDESAKEYLRSCEARMLAFETSTDLKAWWFEQQKMRDSLGLDRNSPEGKKLYNRFIERGKDLATHSNVLMAG